MAIVMAHRAKYSGAKTRGLSSRFLPDRKANAGENGADTHGTSLSDRVFRCMDGRDGRIARDGWERMGGELQFKGRDMFSKMHK
jgi:hypothetical protein